MQPGDGRVVALLFNQVLAVAADRPVRVIVDLASRDVGQLLVQQRRQHADDARLRLPAQPQQNEVVPRQQRVDDVRHHCLLKTDNAREQGFLLLQLANEVLTNLVFYGAGCDPVLRETAGSEGAKSPGKFVHNKRWENLIGRL